MLVPNDDKEILSYNNLLSFFPCFLKPGDPTSPADIRKDSFPASRGHRSTSILDNRPGPLTSSVHTDRVHASKWRTPRRRTAVPKDLPLPRIENGSLEALLRNNPDHYHHAREGRRVILGPMPVKAFLEDFLPPAPDESLMPRSSAAFRGVPSNPRNERDIYIPLAEAINNDRRCPSGKNIDFRDRPFVSQIALDEYTFAEQRTRTHDYIDAPWVCKCLRESLRLRVLKHTHYRVVLKQAGYPLRMFRGSRELFGTTHDALRAINSACTRCKRLHRDVSLDNIILYRFEASQPRRGLLIDWEFSVSADEYGKAIDDTQIGTWPFMSRRALNWSDGFRHTKEDDMESLLYVVMYACVHWLSHNSKSQLGRWIYEFFVEVSVGNRGQFAGGSRKELEQICSGSKFLEKFRFDNPYIRMWFRAAYQYLETDHEIPKQKGVAHLWTMDNFRDVFRNVCLGLSTTEDTNNDRVENEMGDYLAAVDGACHGTDTSLRAAAKTFRANLDSFNTGVDQVEDEIFEYISEYGSDEWHGSERRDSKRRRLDSEQWQDEAISATAHGRQGTRCDHEISSIPAIGDSELFFGLSRKAEKFTISGENELKTCEAVSMTRNAMKPLRRSSFVSWMFNACSFPSPSGSGDVDSQDEWNYGEDPGMESRSSEQDKRPPQHRVMSRKILTVKARRKMTGKEGSSSTSRDTNYAMGDNVSHSVLFILIY
ncbi:hypothetical protein ACEPAI_9743 [Sanghuangporus weigelae]